MIVKNCGGVKSSHQQTYVPTSVRTAFPFRPLPRTSSLRPEGKAHSSVRQRAQLNAFRLKVNRREIREIKLPIIIIIDYRIKLVTYL